MTLKTQVLVALSVAMAEPAGDEPLTGGAPATLLKCRCQGLAEVAVHVIGWSTVPSLYVHLPLSPNDRLLIRICVCVVLAYPEKAAESHVMMPPELASVIAIALAVHIDAVEFDGVTNGDTAMTAPLEAVRFGVANAGDAISTSADATTTAVTTIALRPFMRLLLTL